jgi:hypothetical protein
MINYNSLRHQPLYHRGEGAVIFMLDIIQIQISVFGITRPGLEPMIYRTWGQHANQYATDAVFVVTEKRTKFRKCVYK